MRVAQLQPSQAALNLRKAIQLRKWAAAFRLARELSRPGASVAEIQALHHFEAEVNKLIDRASRAGKKSVAKKMSAALQKFQRESSLYFSQSRKWHWEQRREVQSKSGKSRWAPNRPASEKTPGHFRRGVDTGVHRSDKAIRSDESVELHRRRSGALGTIKRAPVRKQSETEIIERIPHMSLDSTATERRYQVFVYADTNPADPGSSIEPLKLAVPKRITEFKVEASFEYSSHFQIEGSDEGELVFVKSKLESSRASFVVMLTAPQEAGPMFFTALFRYDGRPSGKITRFLEYDAQSSKLGWKSDGAKEKKSEENQVKLPNNVPTSNITCDFAASPSDIRIEILKTAAEDGRSFKLRCFTPAGNWKGLWKLPAESKEFVLAHMNRFTAIRGKRSLAKLQSAGIEFWNSVTSGARSCLKKAMVDYKIVTISVLSEEPFIPWELMIPVAKGTDPVDCLGVTYSMGRWITGDFRSPSQSIPMTSAFIVAPEESGLESAPKEASFLKQALPGSIQLKPVTYDQLDEKLKTSQHDVVHFICHGENADLPILKLDQEEEVDSSEILALKGFLAAFRRHPFVFLNACEVGQPVRSLAGLGGFASSFLDLGASAVVAPLWSVDDPVAAKVCRQFYNDALTGKKFGEAMKKIRAQAFSLGVDTFASYCYYGDPSASVRKVNT